MRLFCHLIAFVLLGLLGSSVQADGLFRSGIFRSGTLIAQQGGGGGGGGGSTSYETPFAYYKLEETSAVDSVSGRDVSTVQFGSVPGGVVQAAQIANGWIFVHQGTWAVRTAISSDWDFSSRNFCIRFWVKIFGTSANYILTDQDDWTNWAIRRNVDDTYTFWSGFSAGDTLTTGNLADGNWHRIVAWHKPGIEIGLKVDNDSSSTTPETDPWNPQDNDFEIQPTTFDGVDEIAIYKDYVPNDSEWTTDWNSGSGRTYPLP